MSTAMPVLATNRLFIRPFVPDDFDALHHMLDVQFDYAGGNEEAWSRAERAEWLQWSIGNYEWLGRLYQPPYGERAVVLQATDEMIGTVGLVPALGPFAQIPSLAGGKRREDALWRPEVGLYYQLFRRHRGHGYASEAAAALVAYAFEQMRLEHIIATTEYENQASIGVMRRLGMTIEKNPFSQPDWLQVVGVLRNDR